MKRTILMTAAVVAFVIAAGIALAHQSRQGRKQQMVQHAEPGHDLKKAQSAQNTERGKTPIDPEAYARYRKAIEPAESSLRTAQELYRSGDLVGAERAAQEAITLAAGLSPLPQETARRLVGQIRMRQGRYEDALQWFKADWMSGKDARLDLNIALCYARLGNYQMARRFFSEEATLKYVRDDLKDEYRRNMPGTGDARSLEASILFARGRESNMGGPRQEAIEDYQAALQLVPQNGLIAYRCAESLEDMNRPAEAEPYFQRAVQYGRGKFVEESATHLKNIAAWRWRKTHP